MDSHSFYVDSRIITSPHISKHAKLIYSILCAFGQDCPSHGNIQEMLPCAHRKLKRAIKELLQRKIIRYAKEPVIDQPCTYIIMIDSQSNFGPMENLAHGIEGASNEKK